MFFPNILKNLGLCHPNHTSTGIQEMLYSSFFENLTFCEIVKTFNDSYTSLKYFNT